MNEEEKEDLARSIADRDYWKSLAPEGFSLIGFTFRYSALFVTPTGGNVDITSAHLKFFGVDPTQPCSGEQEWVSVEERLPEPGIIVIVEGGCAHWESAGWYTHSELSGGPRPIQWDVTHWMPLPAPPSQEQESGG